MTSIWRMTITKRDLVAAISTARTRATLRRRSGGAGFEAWIILAAVSDAAGGLSIRSSDAAMDVDGEGSWPSPIRVEGAALRRLAPKLAGPAVTLTYADGHLVVGTTSLDAIEV